MIMISNVISAIEMIIIVQDIELLQKEPRIMFELLKRIENAYELIYGKKTQIYVKFEYQKSNFYIILIIF